MAAAATTTMILKIKNDDSDDGNVAKNNNNNGGDVDDNDDNDNDILGYARIVGLIYNENYALFVSRPTMYRRISLPCILYAYIVCTVCESNIIITAVAVTISIGFR